MNELARDFAAGTTTTVANANLLPERARSIEAGIDVSARRQQLTVTFFRSVVNDAIANVTTSIVGSAITRQRRNAGDAHSKGVEIDTELQASIVRLRASLTLLDAHFRNSQEAALEGNWLPQVPERSLAVAGDLLLPFDHVASIVVHDVSTQFDDDRNTAAYKMSGAMQVDARIGGAVRMLRWYVAVENLGDTRIETGRSGSTAAPLVTLAQGRAVRAGVTITFGR